MSILRASGIQILNNKMNARHSPPRTTTTKEPHLGFHVSSRPTHSELERRRRCVIPAGAIAHGAGRGWACLP